MTKQAGIFDTLTPQQPDALLALIAMQCGLFSRLPVNGDAVVAIRASHGIYMPTDGRINIAGLNRDNIARFIEGLLPHLPQIADAASGAPMAVTAWMTRDDPTNPVREESCS